VCDKINLRSHKHARKALKKSGIEVLSLANNHIFDQGKKGLIKTVKFLKQIGVKTFGVEIPGQQSSVRIDYAEDKVLGIEGYVDDATHPASLGDESICVNRLILSRIKNDILKLKKQCTCVIIYLHWGLQEHHYPTPYQLEIGRKIIEAGADIVLGSHTHTFQSFEQHKGGVICYGLGNYIFPQGPAKIFNRTGVPADTVSLDWSFWNQYSLVPIFCHRDVGGFELLDIEVHKYNIDIDSIERSTTLEEALVKIYLLISIRVIKLSKYDIVWEVIKRTRNMYVLVASWIGSDDKKLKFEYFMIFLSRVVYGIAPEDRDKK